MNNRIIQLLKLDKPLVIFDLETTGLVMTMDKIIEVAYIKIFPNGRMMKDDMFLNPEMEISKEATEIHGITDEDVASMPTFRDKAKDLWEVFNGCYFGGFNVVNFDLPMLKREFIRVGMDFEYNTKDIVDSKMIFHYMEPRTLSAAYKYYCNKEHINAHSAIADVEATAEILVSQLEKYQEAQDWEFINKIHQSSDDRFVDNERKFYWRNGEAYFSFSKHKDTPLSEVAKTDPGFLQWIMTADFSDETKNIVRKALGGEFPKKIIKVDD